MPKPLSRPQPTSSVAGMLQKGIGVALISKPQRASPAEPTIVTGIPRQFLLSPGADQTLKLLQSVLAEATGLEFRQSEILRAVLLVINSLMPNIRREAATIGSLRRPKNAPVNALVQVELERRVADAVLAACR